MGPEGRGLWSDCGSGPHPNVAHCIVDPRCTLPAGLEQAEIASCKDTAADTAALYKPENLMGQNIVRKRMGNGEVFREP